MKGAAASWLEMLKSRFKEATTTRLLMNDSPQPAKVAGVLIWEAVRHAPARHTHAMALWRPNRRVSWETKALVRTCTHVSRLGISDSFPLCAALIRRLRRPAAPGLVASAAWFRGRPPRTPGRSRYAVYMQSRAELRAVVQ